MPSPSKSAQHVTCKEYLAKKESVMPLPSAKNLVLLALAIVGIASRANADPINVVADYIYYAAGGTEPGTRGGNDAVTVAGVREALATRFLVSQSAILTGFDLMIVIGANSAIKTTDLTVSFYTDIIGEPGSAAALGTLVDSGTFDNVGPVGTVPGVINDGNGDSPGNLPIFTGAMPNHVLLTPGEYWLAVSSSCSGCAEWYISGDGGLGDAAFSTSQNIWISFLDVPFSATVYGDPAVPEPSTALLAITAMIFCALSRRLKARG
jgi:hypothetical protein